MLSFLRNSVTKVVAGTHIGQSLIIKPLMMRYITEAKNKLTQCESELDKTAILHQSPELVSFINDLLKKSNAFISDIEKDELIDPIVTIVAKLISKYPSKEDFIQKIEACANALKFRDFILQLIDFNQYESLIIQIKSIDNVKKMTAAEQKALFCVLSNAELAQQFHQDLKKLDLERIKHKTEKHAKPTCNHLELSPEDTAILMGIFNKVTNQHLPALKAAQEALANHMPSFLETAKAYIVQEYPHVAIEASAPTHTPTLSHVSSSSSASNQPVIDNIDEKSKKTASLSSL